MSSASTSCIDDAVRPASLDSVVQALARSGIASTTASDGTTWITSERWGLSRFPIVAAPAPSETVVRALFQTRRTWVLDFLVPVSDSQEANAFLYLFDRRPYSLEDLSKNGRRDARKAMRELRIGWISHEQLLLHGLTAYADCRRRVGLSDGTPEQFAQRFGKLRDVPGHHFLGAWKEDQLAGFMTIHAIDGSASIAAYSDSAHRASCPSDGLIHFALQHCVNERGLTTVSYGLSSVQEESRAASLHDFKLKTGFTAVPVRRVFRVHPRLAPLVNRGTLGAVHALLRVMPTSRLLKKGSGALSQLLSDASDSPHAGSERS